MKLWYVIAPLTASISFSAGAADIPKEGSYKGIYSAIGSERVDNIGSERLLNTFDEFELRLQMDFLIVRAGDAGEGETSRRAPVENKQIVLAQILTAIRSSRNFRARNIHVSRRVGFRLERV